MSDEIRRLINASIRFGRDDQGQVLTREALDAALKTFGEQGMASTSLVLHKSAVDYFHRLARTRTIRHVGNYVLREFDGQRWWSREHEINDDLDIRSWPRRDPEAAMSPWYLFNRHWRKRGWPESGLDWSQMRQRLPRSQWKHIDG